MQRKSLRHGHRLCTRSDRSERRGSASALHVRGAASAWTSCFRRYRQPAYRVAYRLLGNEADALDAVQEGFVKALTHLDGFQGRSSFKTWLLRVVSNAALDLGRQRGRRETLSLDAAEAADLTRGQLTAEDGSAPDWNRPTSAASSTRPCHTLSEAQRQTFVLFADAELSYREVADALGISIGTVMSRLFYCPPEVAGFPERTSLTTVATGTH